MNTETPMATANERARTRHEQHLAAKVAGQNKVNAIANEYEKQLIKAFRPFVGTKILTHSGIAARVKPHIPEPFNTGVPMYGASLRTWRAPSTYSLYYELDVCERFENGDGCCYCKATAYVGEINGYDLAKVLEPQRPRRTDYTIEEIKAKRQALREARDKMRAIESDLGNFGEYDQ